jgi:hypothetical protein
MRTETHAGLHVKRPLLLLDCNQLKNDDNVACLQLQATRRSDSGSIRSYSMYARTKHENLHDL